MYSKFTQFLEVPIREKRKNTHLKREEEFKNNLFWFLIQYLPKNKIDHFLSENIKFDRDIDEIYKLYQELTDPLESVFSVTDWDGVLIPPFYRYDWVKKEGYENLRNIINRKSNKIIYFSNRFIIPNTIYSTIISLGLHLLLAGSYANQIPHLIPSSLILQNNGQYRNKTVRKNSDILLNLASPEVDISLAKKTASKGTLGNKQDFPSFEYLVKSNPDQRDKCKDEIYNNLLNDRVTIYIGSSKFDREFYIELIKYLVKRLLKEGQPLDKLFNLHYLDSNLSYV